MKFDIYQLFQDYNITYQTEGHKHCRPGWLNIECPFCEGNPGYHLGYNIEIGYFHCWRCGGKSTYFVLERILQKSKNEIYKLLIKYHIDINKNILFKSEENKKISTKPFKLPSNTEQMQLQHYKYLERRGFDPEKIEYEWGVRGTGPVSNLDKIDFRHRLIIPIMWENQIVSFTSRDITNNNDLRYISCPNDRELIHHKDILYGKPNKWNNVGICVEGPIDAWRFGEFAFATFGIKYTAKQLRLIAKTFKRVAVIFDDDTQAVIQANNLIQELKFRNVDAFSVVITGDPADMTQSESDYLIKTIIK
jgi:hypothetical protein